MDKRTALAGSAERAKDVKWNALFAALTRIQAGLYKAQAHLGHIWVDLEAFRKPLEPPGEGGTRV